MPRYTMISGSTVSSASIEELWAVWTDPSRWVGGPIEYAQAHGVFEVGGRYTVKVRGHRPLTATIVNLDRPRGWTSTARVLGLRLTLHHVLEPGHAGVLVTEGVVAAPFPRIIHALLARRLRATYQQTTAHCASLAEADRLH